MLAKFKIGDLLKTGENYIFIVNIKYNPTHSYYEYYFIDHPEHLTTTGISVIDKHFTNAREDENKI